MIDKYPEIMTIGETAEYLRISLSSLYKIAQDGRISCQKVGRHWRFHRGALDLWFQQMNNPPPLNNDAKVLESLK